MKYERVVIGALLLFLIGINAGRLVRVEAQTPAPWSFSVSAPHTSCPAVAAGVSQYCFATDGIWQSLNGVAWVQVGVQAGGVSSITVNGGTAQTGPVALTIPTKVAGTLTLQ